MEEGGQPQAKRQKQEPHDEDGPAALELLDDLSLANAKLIVKNIDTLQEAYQVGSRRPEPSGCLLDRLSPAGGGASRAAYRALP